jgi:transcriptional regulator with XRE-family HTH domain
MTLEERRRLDWLAYRLGLWIREMREKENWTQAELAAKLDVHRNRISRWEKGEKDPQMRSMEIADFVQLCDMFACDPGGALLKILKAPRSTEKMPSAAEYEPEPILTELIDERDPPLTKRERA